MSAQDELKNKNIKGLTKDIEKFFEKFKTESSKMAQDLLRIYKPKDKKTIEINGKTCEISLIEDGRVMIQFSDINSSEEYYRLTPIFHRMDLEATEKRHWDDGIKQGKKEVKDSFNNKNWFKRLFTTWL